MVAKISKILTTALLGALLLAGPVAFRHSCSMGSCCCQPSNDANTDLSFGKAPCCGCGTMEDNSVPIQPVTEFQVIQNHDDRPVLDIEFQTNEITIVNFDINQSITVVNALSPPSAFSRTNTPLIC